MKSLSISTIFNPYYVFLTGSLGVFIALAMFTWNYPLPGDQKGQAFVAAQPFWVWVFLIAILCCLLTVLILPLWGMLIHLLKNRLYVDAPRQKASMTIKLIFQAIVLTLVVFWLLNFIRSERFGFDLLAYVPEQHSARMNFIFIYTFLTALPALLGMLLIHSGVQELSQKMEAVGDDERKLFPLVDDLRSFRSLLQNYLTILGIILSMIPINTAGLRAIIIAVDPKTEQAFPVTDALLFGFVFTILLLLIYIPAHLALTETSRELRDLLCPLDSLDSLKQDVEQRKILDDLLQTNLGLAQNLKTGLITLAPLATSMVSSLLHLPL
jgi:hypothetical protein